MDILFAMVEVDGNTELLMQVFSKVLGTIDATMLTACASESKLKMGKSSVQISLYMEVCQTIDALKEREDFSVLFQKVDDRLVESCQLFVLLITSRIVRTAAIKDITASVSAFVSRNPFLIRERIYSDGKN